MATHTPGLSGANDRHRELAGPVPIPEPPPLRLGGRNPGPARWARGVRTGGPASDSDRLSRAEKTSASLRRQDARGPIAISATGWFGRDFRDRFGLARSSAAN